jgi:hypothetical protein
VQTDNMIVHSTMFCLLLFVVKETQTQVFSSLALSMHSGFKQRCICDIAQTCVVYAAGFEVQCLALVQGLGQPWVDFLF